ncbi:MAG: glycosyltransferase involved in cell wall biosynthesis [Cellvibrionaceae bacterium]|jgi:glycosyltransferase involved in cell wall biosynthesis
MHKDKLRIAVVTTHPPGTGSLNEYAFHFIRYLRLKSEVAEIVLLTDELSNGENYDEVARPVKDSCPVTVMPCWRFNDKKNLWRLFKAVRQIKPDIVLFNIQFASFGDNKIAAALGLMAPALLRFTGYPNMVLLHNIMETVDLKSAGFANNRILEWVIQAAGTVTTRFVLMANVVALTIPKYVEILETKYKTQNIVLAPHGSFEEVAQPSFDLPNGPMRIMTFGKFGTYKKVETLIEAFKILSSNGHPPLELVIAGSDNPNAAGYLESMCQQYIDVPRIRFTGYVSEEDVPIIFGDAAVVVFPYTSTTGSSGVLHQAGDYGKAAVLPNIGDFAEVITEEGYGGEFFQPNDATSLADAISRVIDDPERRRVLGTQNFMASKGLPIDEVVDWYLLHMQMI